MPSKIVSFALVLATLLWAIAMYPSDENIPSSLDWPAIETFFTGKFRSEGFSIICAETILGLSCQLRFKPASSIAQEVQVYTCYEDMDLTRDQVLAAFLRNGSAKFSEQGILRVLGILDGFFESGLRRACDRAVRHARENPASITSLAPFELGQVSDSGGEEVVEIDEAFGKVTVGIPSRPAYRGDVSARVAWPASASDSMISAVRVVAPDGKSSIAILSHLERNPCEPIWPGSSNRFVCQSVTLHRCSIQSSQCQQPLLEVHALPEGRVLLRAGEQQSIWLASRTFAPMDKDEIIVLGAPKESRLYIAGTSGLPGFVVEVFPGGRAPISQLQLVNGRWDRWIQRDLSPWLAPVTMDYDNLVGLRKVKANAKIELSLDLDLQAKLEEGLANWMHAHVEPQVRQHLEAYHYNTRRRSLAPSANERRHRRPIPEAGVTVIDPTTGAILAVASYPPADALAIEDGAPTFGPAWEERLVGPNAPTWARRAVLETLVDRMWESTNSNFVTHPIGSTFKPLLLSLTIDKSPKDDHLERLFDLVLSGHIGSDGVRNGGDPSLDLSCGAECATRGAESVIGLPIGPWGQEEGAAHGGAWIDRWDFLIGSCNKYALSLGALSFLDWSNEGEGGPGDLCCWNTLRDTLGFVERHVPGGGTLEPIADQRFAGNAKVPKLGPWARIINGRLSTSPQFPEAPIFGRLQSYFGVSSRTRPDPYDADPWMMCGGLELKGQKLHPQVGRVALTQLDLTAYPVETSFINLFTGAGRNWWSNLKFAEAFSRISTNRPVMVSFCERSASPTTNLFQDSRRQSELIKILSLQRQEASWVETPQIDAWQEEASEERVTLSKTGTTLRTENSESTGIFALFLGEVADRDSLDSLPIKIGKGLIVVAHVDDVGGSSDVTDLVDNLFQVALRERL